MHQHNDWMEHDGLVKPTLILPEGAVFEVKFRDGSQKELQRESFSRVDWVHRMRGTDITGYRIKLLNPPPLQEGEIVLSAADVQATREWAKMFLAATDPAGADALTVDDYREVLADKQRLTKELDELLFGGGGAAKPSLCDIVAQVKGIVGHGIKPLLARLPVMERIGRVKMSGLESEGWVIAGYAIQKGDRFGMVTGGGRVLWWDDSMGEMPDAESDWVMSGPEALAALMWPSYPTELGHMHQALISASGQQVYVMAFGDCAMTCIQLAQKVEAAITGKQHPDDVAVDKFAVAMKNKMAASRAKGRSGWDDPEQCSVESLAGALIDHLIKGDPVDIGNFAMMLHQRKAGSRVLGSEAYERVDATSDGEWVKAASDLILHTPCIDDKVFKPSDPVATLDGIVHDVREYTRIVHCETRDLDLAERYTKHLQDLGVVTTPETFYQFVGGETDRSRAQYNFVYAYIQGIHRLLDKCGITLGGAGKEIAPASPEAEFGVVRVEISGFTGCGKSAVAGVLERALVAHGLNVDWVGGREEKNLRPSVDFSDELRLHMPLVKILERNVAQAKGDPIRTLDDIPPIDPEFSAEYWADLNDGTAKVTSIDLASGPDETVSMVIDVDALAHPKVSLIDVQAVKPHPVTEKHGGYVTTWFKNTDGVCPVIDDGMLLMTIRLDSGYCESIAPKHANGWEWRMDADSVDQIVEYGVMREASDLPVGIDSEGGSCD